MDVIGTRIARNPETGENYKVPGNMKYEDWKKAFVNIPAPQKKSGNQLNKGIENFDIQQAKQETVDFLYNIGTYEASQFALMLESTDFVEDEKLKISPIAYNPADDIIKYNPNHPDYDFYVENSLTLHLHELSHEYDYRFGVYSWKNEKFLRAIEKAKNVVNQHFGEIEKMFAKGAIYEEDASLSDIMSALTLGKMDLPFYHNEDYWNKSTKSVPREVFANLKVLKLQKKKHKGVVTEIIKILSEGVD